jgi:hypothetical protein
MDGWKYRVACLLSLVVEHSLCKRKVGGSIPPVGYCCFLSGVRKGLYDSTTLVRGRTGPNKNDMTTSQRFELWRAEPNRFLIYLLNHSDTMSNLTFPGEANWRRGLAR